MQAVQTISSVVGVGVYDRSLVISMYEWLFWLFIRRIAVSSGNDPIRV